MTDSERDAKLNEVYDMTVRMHEALIVAKIPQRVSSLEGSRSWAMGAGAVLGAVTGWLSAHLGGSK